MEMSVFSNLNSFFLCINSLDLLCSLTHVACINKVNLKHKDLASEGFTSCLCLAMSWTALERREGSDWGLVGRPRANHGQA